jgi:hypothetical protein
VITDYYIYLRHIEDPTPNQKREFRNLIYSNEAYKAKPNSPAAKTPTSAIRSPVAPVGAAFVLVPVGLDVVDVAP